MTTGQEKIWEYFQGSGHESFAGARPRLGYLARRVAKLARRSDPRVLTIGVGDGFLEKTLREIGCRIEALDPDQHAVARLSADGISAHHGYIEHMPFPDDLFDFVIASEVLEHLNDEQYTAGLREITRVLREGGYFLGTVPHDENLSSAIVVCPKCGEVFHRWGHHRTFKIDAVLRDFSSHFVSVRASRMAFVDFRNRTWYQTLKGVALLALAKLGEPIAFPSIFFAARK